LHHVNKEERKTYREEVTVNSFAVATSNRTTGNIKTGHLNSPITVYLYDRLIISNSKAMKKLFIIFSALLISFSLIARDRDPGGIDEKLLQSFNTSFPTAEQVHWYEMPKAYVVNFVSGGIRSRVVYLKDGKVSEFTRYYLEGNLPFLIRSRVKEAYADKKIFGVVEVTTVTEGGNNSTVVYYVKLEGDKYWLTVKSDNEGNLVVVEKYRKAQ